MPSWTNSGLGSTDQDSVSTVYAGQEFCLPLGNTAPGEHGTRPPISPLGTCEIPGSDCNANEGNTNPRPPPAPSISNNKPPLNLILPPNKQRARRGCLKLASPLPSPSLISQEASPASNYTSFYHTLGGPASSPSTPGSNSRGSSGSSTPKKTVSWCSHEQKGLGYLEEVFPADDWDRTATEPARTPLSYKDILELKAIQRTLPHAQQLPDPFTGKPGNQYLSNVPIALLPLLPDSAPHTPLSTPNISPGSSTGVTPDASGCNTPLNTSPRGSRQPSPRQSPRSSPVSSPSRSPSHSPERASCSPVPPPAHAHLPRISSPLVPPPPPSGTVPLNSNTLAPPVSRPRNKPVFNFIPLLDTPTTSSVPSSPPLDSMPQALDAALLSIRRRNESFNQNEEDSPPVTPALTVMSLGTDSCSEVDTELSDIGEDIPFGVMFRKDADGSFDSYSRWRGRSVERKEKKKNVFYINGEEIDLDGVDGGEDEVEESKPSGSPPEANVIYINGEACTLDDPIDLPPSKFRSRSPSPSETERKPRFHSPISPFHRAHPNVSSRTFSPPPERKSRSCQVPISPFHRAHPNVAGRSRTPSPAAAEKMEPPVSAFH